MTKKSANRKWGTLYLLAASVFVWSIALLRARTACLTYDEAYSYCSYIHPLQLTKLSSIKAVFTDCFANNHILNTVLCNLAVKLSGRYWNDFVIRIPVLIFFGIYLSMVIVMYQRKKIGCIAATFLIWNYYMNEFFGLARGYGLAAAMVMVALVMYQLWCDSDCQKFRYLSLFLLFMTLGVMANTIVLLIFAAFVPFIGYQLLRSKKLFRYAGCQCFVWIPLLLVNILMLRYHLMVTGGDKPLYIGEGIWENVCAGYAGFLFANEIAAQAAAVAASMLAIVGLALFVVNRRCGQTCYLFPGLCYFAILLILQFLVRLGIPRGRELLPSYPVIVLLLAECMKEIGAFCQKRMSSERAAAYRTVSGSFGVLASVVLIVLFLFRIDLESYSEWRDEKDYRTIAYDAVTNPNADYEAIANMDYPMQYYWAQIYLNEKFDIYTGQRVE